MTKNSIPGGLHIAKTVLTISAMEQQYFMGFTGETPASIEINGHKVLFLSTEREQLEECLEEIGGECVQPVGEESETPELIIQHLSVESEVKVIIASEDLPIPLVIEGLRQALPWTH